MGAVAQPRVLRLAQRGGSPVAVIVVPLNDGGQHILVAFFYALLLLFQPAAAGAGLWGGGQVNFNGGLGQHHRADIPPIHDDIVLPGQAALLLQQVGPYLRQGGNSGGGRGGLRQADGLRNILAIQQDALLARLKPQVNVDLRQQGESLLGSARPALPAPNQLHTMVLTVPSLSS